MSSLLSEIVKKGEAIPLNHERIMSLIFQPGENGAFFLPVPSASGKKITFPDINGVVNIADTDEVSLLLDMSKSFDVGVDEFSTYVDPSINDSGGSAGAWDGLTAVLTNTAVGTSTTHPRYNWAMASVPYWRKVTHRFTGDVDAVGLTGATSGGPGVIYRKSLGADFSKELSFYVPPNSAGALLVFMDGTTEYTVAMECTVKELKGSHAYQTGASKLVYRTDGLLHWLEDDLSGNSISADLPDLGGAATVAYATDSGVTVLTGQTISGATELPHFSKLYGAIYRENAFSPEEDAGVRQYLETLRGG